MGTSLQNLFKPIGGGSARPVKDPFLSRYSPTDSDDDDKLLDIGDDNVDDISEDFSLNEDSLLMPDETQKDEQPVNYLHQKDILSKPLNYLLSHYKCPEKLQFLVQCLQSINILVRMLHQQERNMPQGYLVMVFWKQQLIL